MAAASEDNEITLLDYGAGNVRSVRNAIHKLGYRVRDVTSAADLQSAHRVVFPGVGCFGAAVERLHQMGVWDELIAYVRAGRPFLGICVGMQVLFEEGEESPGVKGLGVIPGRVDRFQVSDHSLSVPHIGWNGVNPISTASASSSSSLCSADDVFYFVHSYRALPSEANRHWIGAVTDYGEKFISMVHRGAVFATQFHPEKSGTTGLAFLQRFLSLPLIASPMYTLIASSESSSIPESHHDEETELDWQNVQLQLNATTTVLRKRVIACLDVRLNDAGDIVVTKGDQYDVRSTDNGHVRNLGKPVELAERYYQDGADEVTFLNITGFRENPLNDSPMRRVLELTSENVFVPLTIGGGIRDFVDETDGRLIASAVDVASAYFRSGADKVSIGSDAVLAAEAFFASNRQLTGQTCIELISKLYGRQAVVVSIDPRRVYASQPSEVPVMHRCIELTGDQCGPQGERFCWYQCTIKGGREGRPLDVFQLADACFHLGAGELLVNSIDADGSKRGFDTDLLNALSQSVSLPVIASSGAGCVEHFSSVFRQTSCEAALAAGIFHRREVLIQDVKKHLETERIPVRK